MPVFIYSFLRARGIDVSFSLLLRLSGITKHKCFQTLKKINKSPEYVNRDQKQLILGKISKIENHFHLNSKFSENASRILLKLWELLKNTTATSTILPATFSIFSWLYFTIYCVITSFA